MRLLLDTNILIPLVDGRGETLPAPILSVMGGDGAELFASVASVWEVALKHRLGKLPLPCPLADWPAALKSLHIQQLPIEARHVVEPVLPALRTNDPFDHLLIAMCASERMRLLTRDKALVDHPLAWRPASA